MLEVKFESCQKSITREYIRTYFDLPLCMQCITMKSKLIVFYTGINMISQSNIWNHTPKPNCEFFGNVNIMH